MSNFGYSFPSGCGLQRSGLSIQRENGTYTAGTLKYMVSVAADVDEVSAIAVALEHPLIPKEGSRIIPGIPLYVQSLSANLVDREVDTATGLTGGYIISVDVSCVGYGSYNGPGIFTYYVSCNTRSVGKTSDRYGQRIYVKYKPKDKNGNVKKDKDDNDIEITQYPTVEREQAEVVITAKGVVYCNDIGAELGNRWIMMRNNDQFVGCAPGTLLCTGLELDPIDLTSNPRKWRLQLKFQSRPEGWNPIVAWTNPDTGEVPPDVTLGESENIKFPELYGSIDYATTWPLNGVIESPGPAEIPTFVNLDIGVM